MVKTLLIVVAVLSVAGLSTAGDMAGMEKIAETCREGTSVTKELVTSLMKNDVGSASVDQATKCYFACLLEKVGLMHDDGKIEVDAAHQHFTDCANSAMDSDRCEKAFNFNRCVYAQHPDLPFF